MTVTYAELDSRVAATARRLAALGVAPGSLVATTLPPGLEFADLLHALPRLGAVLVPLNTRLTAGERRLQVATVSPRLVIEEPVSGDQADVGLRTTLDPRATQTVLFTSGTSAAPKPVELTYRNHAASALASAWNLGVAPDDRWLCVLPLFHIGGLAILLRSAIYGTAAVVHQHFDEHAVATALGGGRAALISLVPTMLGRLRDAGLEAAPLVRAMLLGGGPMPRELLSWAARRGLPVVPTYGMTETASQIATLSAEEALAGRAALARPLPGVRLRTAGDGELLVRGPMVAPGEIAADGWLHTGDAGRLEPDGCLRVEGRLKDVVVSGGENVAPAEVEDALGAHPAVTDAAVVGLPDPEWGEAVCAFVVLGGPASEDELIAHCRARLAPYKVPKRVRRVASLPRNVAGKLQRGELARGSGSGLPPQRLQSAAVIYDDGADLGKLDGKAVAILGYGSQGHAHALNLQDSGIDVVVGLREESASVEQAKAHGLEVLAVADAASRGDLIMVLLPDEKQGGVWESDIRDGIAPGNLVMFAHGFSIHYGQVEPGPEVDVGMVAPKGPGHLVRRQYEAGNGVPGLIAIHQDATGEARDLVLAYAKGIGCTRAGVIETSFREETETDLFGEQSVLCGGVTELVRAGYETLVDAGYDSRLAYFECLHELKLIVDLMYENGISGMRYSISNTAEYGDLTRGKRVIGEPTRQAMRQILDEIQSGAFAREWIAENQAGQESFQRMRQEQQGHRIEREGKELRSMMDWIDQGF